MGPVRASVRKAATDRPRSSARDTGRRHSGRVTGHITPGRGLRRRLQRAVDELRLPAGPGDPAPVTEDDLAPLPDAARRWLRAAGVVGRPRTWSFRVRFRAQFRLRPGQPWLQAESWQYTNALAPARVYAMRIDMARGALPLFGLDTYAAGRGRMVGRTLGLVKVVDGRGPELDLGELTTYLNDAVMLAPSSLLVPAVTWDEVDDRDVAITDAGLVSRARVTLDDRDEAVDFVSSDRFADLPGGMVRAPWSTPRTEWVDAHGRVFPAGGRAVWHLEGGDYEYGRGAFLPETLVTDIAPSAAAAALPPAS